MEKKSCTLVPPTIQIRRMEEHDEEGKQFTHMTVLTRRMTKEGAKAKEEERLAAYRKGHGGKIPKYNKDSDG